MLRKSRPFDIKLTNWLKQVAEPCLDQVATQLRKTQIPAEVAVESIVAVCRIGLPSGCSLEIRLSLEESGVDVFPVVVATIYDEKGDSRRSHEQIREGRQPTYEQVTQDELVACVRNLYARESGGG